MSTKAKRKTRGDLQLEAESKKKLRAEFGLDFKGSKIYQNLPAQLQPSDYHIFHQQMKKLRRQTRKR